MKERVLIIVAHPDDETLGCGGYISKFKKNKNFRIVFICEGTSCRYSENYKRSEIDKEISKRNKDSVKAMHFLGVKNFKFYNLPCGRLDKIDILNINKIIEFEINQFKPMTIITHSSEDCNNDHRIVFRSVSMATRPSPQNTFIKEILSCEILSSTEWNFDKVFEPNYFIELKKKDLENKIKSMNFYKSEIQKGNMPRTKDGLITLAKFRGKIINKQYAEVFRILRKIS